MVQKHEPRVAPDGIQAVKSPNKEGQFSSLPCRGQVVVVGRHLLRCVCSSTERTKLTEGGWVGAGAGKTEIVAGRQAREPKTKGNQSKTKCTATRHTKPKAKQRERREWGTRFEMPC